MKVAFFSLIFSLCSLFARTVADVTLETFPTSVVPGRSYTVSWTATTNYTYTLWLVVEKANAYGNPYAWSQVQSLVQGLEFSSLDGAYTWTVPSTLNSSSTYAIWFDCLVIPANGQVYNVQTNYFTINPGYSASATVSPTSVPPASTLTITTSALNHLPTTTSTGTSNGNSSVSHHSSLSGGAIAGIVIGCLLAIALIVGAIIFIAWRRKRSAIQKREAAARASRLDPVMKAGGASYEMHGRSPQLNKETNI